MSQFVLIGGLPRSGNRLIARMLRNHWVETRVYHRLSGWECDSEPTHIIVPTRKMQWLSCEAHNKKRDAADSPKKVAKRRRRFRSEDMDSAQGQRRMQQVMLDTFQAVPTLHVTYEEMVSDSVRVGQQIADFCGIEKWRGWFEVVYDGNSKYRDA